MNGWFAYNKTKSTGRLKGVDYKHALTFHGSAEATIPWVYAGTVKNLVGTR